MSALVAERMEFCTTCRRIIRAGESYALISGGAVCDDCERAARMEATYGTIAGVIADADPLAALELDAPEAAAPRPVVVRACGCALPVGVSCDAGCSAAEPADSDAQSASHDLTDAAFDYGDPESIRSAAVANARLHRAALAYAAAALRESGEAGTESAAILLDQIADEFESKS